MRLIDADALDKSLLRAERRLEDDGEIRPAGAVLFCRGIVEKMPTIDAEPVRHGRWSIDGECSECEKFDVQCPFGSAYCPHCGAKMEMPGGEDDGDDADHC